MNEETSLAPISEVLTPPKERKKREGERESIILDSFQVPLRNWQSLIETYNRSNRVKFPLSSIECKSIIELVKRGYPAKYIFKSLGYSAARYTSLVNKTTDLEIALENLAMKPNLSEEESKKYHTLSYHPLRILFADIDRAAGIADLCDWETFNEEAKVQPDLLIAKMKAKFKDTFDDKDSNTAGVNVQINVGGDWVDSL